MIKTPIHNFLRSYSEKEDNIRCHMPGHKGHESLYKSDITEILGADSLYESSGIISESEGIASTLFGSAATFYSAGGSTLVIQTMLSLLKKTGKNGRNKVIAGRYCHKSLISTAVLLGLEIIFVYPDENEYLSAQISSEAVENAVRAYENDVLGVFLTSIDYYGGMCDIEKISRITVKYRLPLLVDNAHGAYLVFLDNHPLKYAYMCADSAHKTLPALTGAAYLHIGNSEYTEFLKSNAKNEMSLFGSSSPSYLILESLDLCNRRIAEGKERAEQAFYNVKNLKHLLSEHGYILKESDSLRIVINAKGYGCNGFDLARELRDRRVECEMCDENYVILLFSTVTEKHETDGVYNVLKAIPKKNPLPLSVFPTIKPRSVIPPREAYYSPSETIPLENAVSRLCAEICAPCPPCVPLIMPGEVFSAEVINTLKLYGVSRVQVLKLT